MKLKEKRTKNQSVAKIKRAIKKFGDRDGKLKATVKALTSR